MPTVPTIVLKVFRAQAHGPRQGRPDLSDVGLLKVVAMECGCGKPLGREQALALLGRAFPQLGRVWYVSPHPQGWIKCIQYRGGTAWVLICHPRWLPSNTAGRQMSREH